MRWLWLYLLLLSYVDINCQKLLPGFKAEKLFTGLNPTTFTFGPEGRIFLLDKSGKVLIINTEGELLAAPLISLEIDDFNERGLSGIAFHPRFEDFPYVYLYYSVKTKNRNRVSRFRINGNQVVPNSEEVLIELNTLSGFIHNGGRLVFDREEYLYVSVGDGADKWSAQSSKSLLGKILRLDAEGNIPVDNPYFGIYENEYQSIWASGLRNPFSMSINRHTGQLFVGDVGDGKWEEINEILPGKNFGWPYVEGPAFDQEVPTNYRPPHYVYNHDVGCAILGVTVLDQASSYPDTYQNNLFYADYCKGTIHYLDGHEDHSHLFASDFERPVDIQVSPQGELYVLTRKGLGGGSIEDNTSTEQGELWRISYVGDGPPQISIQRNPVNAVIGETIQLEVQAFGTLPIQYNWFEHDSLISSAPHGKLEIEILDQKVKNSTFFCIAANEYGSDTSDIFSLNIIDGSRPTAIIELPMVRSYKALDNILFKGFALDKEDGLLPDSLLTWRVDFHHQEHTHPALDPLLGKSSGLIQVPSVTETDTFVWYRVLLSASDFSGLTATSFVDLFPLKATYKINGPAGATINIDGINQEIPFKSSTVQGVIRNFLAPNTTNTLDSIYLFNCWSDHHTDPLLTIPIWGDTLLNIKYDGFRLGSGNGFYATYFNAIDPLSIDGISRIDTTIDFKWLDRSPWPDTIQADQYSVVWSGLIQPIFDGWYDFSVFTDDGLRLWVGDTLLINAWNPRPPTENSSQIYLSKDTLYPIIMAYFEDLGFAISQLSWAHKDLTAEVIPKRQIYATQLHIPGNAQIHIWYDENENGVHDQGELFVENVQIQSSKIDKSDGFIGITDNRLFNSSWLQPGNYRIEYTFKNQLFIPAETLIHDLEIKSLDTTIIDIPLVKNPKSLEFNEEIQYFISPNPVINSLNIDIFSSGLQVIDLSIYNEVGQQLHQEFIHLRPGYQQFIWSTKELIQGKYHFVLKNTNDQQATPFIKINP